jgi:hypothetical protein
MALQRYVDTDYAEFDYFLEWDDSAYLEPDYVDSGYVGNVVFAEADLIVTASASVQPFRILQFAQSLSVVATVNNFGGRLPTASADLDAFNTVITAAGRIGNGTVLMEATATVTALGGKLKSASVNNYLQLENPTPYLGVYLPNNTTQRTELFSQEYIRGADVVQGVDDLDWGTDDVAISFYAQRFTAEGGTVFSSDGRANNQELAIQLSLTNNSISLRQNYSAGLTGGFNLSLTFSPIANNEWHHYYIRTGNRELFIDGVSQGQLTGTSNSDGLRGLDGLSLGVKRARGVTIGLGGTIVPFTAYSEPIDGVISQLWIGPFSATGVAATIEDFYLFNNEGNLDVAFQDLGADGKKSNLIPQPFYYETFDYVDDAYGELVANALTPPEQSYSIIGPTAVATLNVIGDNISFTQADLAAEFTTMAVAGQSLVENAALNVSATFTATPYDFTKASSAVNSTTEFVALPTDFSKAELSVTATTEFSATTIRIRPGAAELLALESTATFTAVAEGIISADADLISEFTLSAEATTNRLGSMSVAVEATTEFTPYEFTKASADFSTTVELSAEARILVRIRATADTAAAFTTVAVPSRTRDTLPINLSVVATVAPTSVRIFPAQAVLSAFNTVFTAGKLLELLDENIIRVRQESRLLLAQDLELTILTVDSAQGVNTVMAEPRTIEVDSETRTLLSQFN